ncbi:MAG: SUMF1/EgtB/PvdO family nonheme iron enzyme [Chloroflexi bacterium]|nr:SUMF1/EgtB/PvdO family nonheme iron enzyme [Chloroflexota bacterium]
MDTVTFDAIVNLLMQHPQWESERDRPSLIKLVFLDAESAPDIDYAGAPRAAARRAVFALSNYGTLLDGQPALARLLALLRSDFGVNKQVEIDRLIKAIATSSGPTAPPPPQLWLIYAPEDRPSAEATAGALQHAGYCPWLDTDGLHSQELWEQSVLEAIKEAAAAVVLLTPHALKSSTSVRRDVALAQRTGTPLAVLVLAPLDDLSQALQELGAAGATVVDRGSGSVHEGFPELSAMLLSLTGRMALPQPPPPYTSKGQAARPQPTFSAPSTPTLDPASLHQAYLWSWFGKLWTWVSLADFSDRQERVSLLDVYVPLRVDFAITVHTQDQRITDWWATDERAEAGLIAHDARLESVPKRRDWPSLGVGAVSLQQIINGIQRKIDQREEKAKDGDHIWYMEAHDAASVQPRFVLVGDPGSGKSSFVRHLALCMAGAQLRELGVPNVPANASLEALRDWLLGAYTPIYIELRHLVQEVFAPLPADEAKPAPLPDIEHFWRYVRRHILGEVLAAYQPHLLQRLLAGQAIILLDGLDEVSEAADPRRRQQVKAFVGTLAQYSRTRIIVTSRPYAYRRGDWALEGFGRAELRPLSRDRLHELAQALFKNLLSEQADAEAQAFFEALNKVPDDLRRNPLFFTLLAAIWLRSPGDHHLPETRGELYRRSLDLMLAKWAERKIYSRSLADLLNLRPEQLRIALQIIASAVHGASDAEGGTAEFHRKDLADVIADLKKGVPPDRVWDYLEQRAGILVSGRSKYFRFAHRSFQEHLAACELTYPPGQPRVPPVALENRFPLGLAQRILVKPDLWRNVAWLAADELSGVRHDDLWRLLSELIRPLVRSETDLQARQVALLALEIAQEQGLLSETWDELSSSAPILKALRQTALTLLIDLDFTPERRLIAGQVLSTLGDPRPGVTLTPDPSPSGRGELVPDIDWVPIPDDGEFIYGEGETQRSLRLPPYQIGRYPVTYAQFQAFVDTPDGFHNPEWWQGLTADNEHRRQPGEQAFRYANHPRERVSWYDAVAFCRWLSEKLGYEVRLPTEWEWEKAARGLDGRAYPWGKYYIAGYANINETYDKAGPHYLQSTSAAGMYPQGVSPYGVMDMSGNVWEWCLNKYDDPTRMQLEGASTRVVRGGSWNDFQFNARAASRVRYLPYERSSACGFRVVAAPVPQL